MQVRDVATMQVLSVSPETSIRQVAEKMRESAIGMLPVACDGCAMGVITDRDIVTRVVAEALDVDLTKAYEIMTPCAMCINADADVREAECRMSAYRIRRLLVTDGTQLVGVLSVDDLALQDLDAHELSHILSESASSAVLDCVPSFTS